MQEMSAGLYYLLRSPKSRHNALAQHLQAYQKREGGLGTLAIGGGEVGLQILGREFKLKVAHSLGRMYHFLFLGHHHHPRHGGERQSQNPLFRQTKLECTPTFPSLTPVHPNRPQRPLHPHHLSLVSTLLQVLSWVSTKLLLPLVPAVAEVGLSNLYITKGIHPHRA